MKTAKQHCYATIPLFHGKLDAKLLDDSLNMKSLDDIMLSNDYLKDVKEHHMKSYLIGVLGQIRASTSYLLKDISSKSDPVRLLNSFRYFHPAVRIIASSFKMFVS